jgi:hypothetical protein
MTKLTFWTPRAGIASALSAITTVVAAASAMATGCSSSNATTPANDAGASGETGVPSPAPEAGSPETGSPETGSPETGSPETGSPETGSPGDAGSTLYQRLGEHAGIRAAVNAIVAAELQNQDIASYFFFQSGAPGNGHPTADQIEECFTDLVASNAGGPETYGTITTDAGSYTCRSMATIHAPLLISGGTFDEFVMIAGSTLTNLGVSSADVTTLASVLVGTKTDIVTSSLGDAGLEPFPGDGGSQQAGDGGSQEAGDGGSQEAGDGAAEQ